ncbi:Uncharacterised protein [Aerococcus viridans]|nr:Uncharacterised protein [Aerococcus viridans]
MHNSAWVKAWGELTRFMTVDEIFEELINGFQERHTYMTNLSAVFK